MTLCILRNKADLVFAQQVDAAAAADGRVQVEREVEPIGLRFGIIAVVIQCRAAAVLVELHQRSAVQRDRTAVCMRLYMAPAQIGFQQGCRNVSGVGVKTDVLCIQPIGRQRAVLNRFADCVQAMSISRNDVLSRGIMRVTVPLFAQMFAVHLPFWVKELVATL